VTLYSKSRRKREQQNNGTMVNECILANFFLQDNWFIAGNKLSLKVQSISPIKQLNNKINVPIRVKNQERTPRMNGI